MKIQTECVPCLIKRIIFEAEQSTNDKKIKTRIIKEATKLLSELYDPDVCSATIATKIHKLAYEILQDNDPYEELKFASNKIAESILPRVKHLINCSDDSLRIAMLSSIIGNLMDFGIEGGSDHPERLAEIFEEVFVQDLGYDDSEEIKKILKKSKNIMLFTDNCGEIVFDRLLCKELKKFKPDIFLTLVVKGVPILSDATMQDALDLGFIKVVDEILTTGCFAVGIDFSKLPKDVKARLKETDLVICKGMANYEAFSEIDYKPVAYLLRTKCTAIANSMGLELNINAVKLYK